MLSGAMRSAEKKQRCVRVCAGSVHSLSRGRKFQRETEMQREGRKRRKGWSKKKRFTKKYDWDGDRGEWRGILEEGRFTKGFNRHGETEKGREQEKRTRNSRMREGRGGEGRGKKGQRKPHQALQKERHRAQVQKSVIQKGADNLPVHVSVAFEVWIKKTRAHADNVRRKTSFLLWSSALRRTLWKRKQNLT